MKGTKVALVVVAAVFTIAVFLSAENIFPPTREIASQMPMALLPAFVFLDFWDALAFGVGVALLIYGAMNYSKWPQAIRTPLAIMFFLALWFTLLNWVHDGLHRSTEGNFYALVGIELTFHVPWVIFSGLLVWSVIRLSKTYQAK